MKLGSVLLARCPACDRGKVTQGLFAIKRRCPECDYDLHPEPGFYLGAMVVGFLLSAILTVPPLVVLKLSGADLPVLVAFPLLEFVFVGTFLLFYCRVLWLHLEYQLTRRLASRDAKNTQSGDPLH